MIVSSVQVPNDHCLVIWSKRQLLSTRAQPDYPVCCAAVYPPIPPSLFYFSHLPFRKLHSNEFKIASGTTTIRPTGRPTNPPPRPPVNYPRCAVLARRRFPFIQNSPKRTIGPPKTDTERGGRAEEGGPQCTGHCRSGSGVESP